MMLFYALLCAQISTMFTVRRWCFSMHYFVHKFQPRSQSEDDAFLCTTLCTNFNHVHSQKMMHFYALLCAQISTTFTVRRWCFSMHYFVHKFQPCSQSEDDAFLCTTLCTNFNHVHSQKMMLFYALLCAQISTMFTVRSWENSTFYLSQVKKMDLAEGCYPPAWAGSWQWGGMGIFFTVCWHMLRLHSHCNPQAIGCNRLM